MHLRVSFGLSLLDEKRYCCGDLIFTPLHDKQGYDGMFRVMNSYDLKHHGMTVCVIMQTYHHKSQCVTNTQTGVQAHLVWATTADNWFERVHSRRLLGVADTMGNGLLGKLLHSGLSKWQLFKVDCFNGSELNSHKGCDTGVLNTGTCTPFRKLFMSLGIIL